MGQIYVEVTGDTANGIMTMDASGGGQQQGYWLYWTAQGYTGTGWYWSEADNYVSIGWPDYVSSGKLTCGVEHTQDQQGLINHISGGHADDLNDVLGPWPAGEKMRFVGRYYDVFEAAGCLRGL